MCQSINLCDLNGVKAVGLFNVGVYLRDVLTELDASRVNGFISKDLDIIFKDTKKTGYPDYVFVGDKSKPDEVRINYVMTDGSMVGSVVVSIEKGALFIRTYSPVPIQQSLI